MANPDPYANTPKAGSFPSPTIDLGFSPTGAVGSAAGGAGSFFKSMGTGNPNPHKNTPRGGSFQKPNFSLGLGGPMGSVGGAAGNVFGGTAEGQAPTAGFDAMNIQPLYPQAPAVAKAAPARTPQRQAPTKMLGSVSTNNAQARQTGDWLGNMAAPVKSLPNFGGGLAMRPFGGGGMAAPAGGMAAPARAVQPPMMSSGVSANRQAAANQSAPYQSARAKASDPNNWAGIARDLGNAGSGDFKRYKTGGIASTNAQNFVRNRTAAAFVPGATITPPPAPKTSARRSSGPSKFS